VVIHPVAVQQVVHIVTLPPIEMVLVEQVIAIAAVVNNVAIITNIVFILCLCLNDRSALLVLQSH
jgi:hypothetical protein